MPRHRPPPAGRASLPHTRPAAARLVLAAAALACWICAQAQPAGQSAEISAQAPLAATPISPAAPAPGDGSLFTNVTTPEQLTTAVASVRHVVLVDHLDLTTLERQGASPLILVSFQVKSIRGACSDAVLDNATFPGFQRTRKQQCLVYGAPPLIELKTSRVRGTSSSVVAWLSDLYLLVAQQLTGGAKEVLTIKGGAAWLTDVDFDAGNHKDMHAVKTEPFSTNVYLYARTCSFRNFQNSQSAVLDLTSTSAVIAQSTFSNNTLRSERVESERYIVIQVLSSRLGAAAGVARSNLWIQNSEFITNQGLRVASMETVTDASPAFEIDDISRVYSNLFGVSSIVDAGSQATLREPAVPGDGSFSIDDYWLEDREEFKAIVKEQTELTGLEQRVPVPLHPDPEPFPKVEAHPAEMMPVSFPDDPGRLTGGVLIIFAVAMVLVVLVVALAVLVVVWWRRVGSVDDPENKRARKAMLGSHSESVRSESGTRNGALVVRSVQGSQGTSSRGGTGALQDERMRSTLNTYLFDPTEVLENTLDYMHKRQELFLGLYKLLDAVQRRKGGQGVVQFVRRVKDGREFVIKFFTDKAAFEREATLCKLPGLKHVMPRVHDVNDNEDGLIKCSNGVAFPAFTIVDKGESLSEWVERVEPDYITSMFVLCHVAKRLQLLHTARMSHRDLKPANLLWQPLDNSWKLLDFGCAADNGKPTELNFSPGYAAPEVIAAWEAGEPTIIAEAAVDIWAIGVVAFELLTGVRMFEPGMKNEDIFARIRARELMLWEDPAKAPALLKKLGTLKRTIMQCLERDPTKRPTAEGLLNAWNGVFDLKVNGQASAGGGGQGPSNITGSTAWDTEQGSAYWTAASLTATNGTRRSTASQSIHNTNTSLATSTGASLSVKDWGLRTTSKHRGGLPGVVEESSQGVAESTDDEQLPPS